MKESTTFVTAQPAFRRRLGQLLVGLVCFGISLALMVRAELGLGPWDVLHQGIAERMDLEIGTVVIAVSVLILALWIPLRQRPGLGTLANVVVVGLAVNATLTLLPGPDHLAARLALLAAGVVSNGAATGMYIGAGLGPGPRDGLMTGLAQRGLSIRPLSGMNLIPVGPNLDEQLEHLGAEVLPRLRDDLRGW
jgi:uncharacterized membrane protein YczE